MEINDTNARELLRAWNDLNKVIATLDEANLNYLLGFELRTRNRKYFLERIFQRLSVVRRDREWVDLVHQHEQVAAKKK